MRTIGSLTLAAAFVLLGTLATPAPAAASDCGGSYVACLFESGLIGTSDQLHEMECYGDYIECVKRQLIRL